MKKYIVSYSGGIGSFVTAHRLKSFVPNDNIELVFCDTLIEDEDLYRFLNQSAKSLGLTLICLADGRNPWEVFRDVKLQGNSRIAPCSKILKRIQMDKYLSSLSYEFCLVLGIDYTESERLERAKKNNNKYEVIAPLCDEPFLSYQDKLNILKEYGLELPRLYKMGFPHNNCGGFCVRAGLAQFRLLKKMFPERFVWHKDQQNKLVNENPSLNKPFLRKVKNGVTHYITLEEFESMELDKQEEFDFGGCGCFIDDSNN
jgi:3'-phosphoadenosine 5'-phosphosulfate sulfotransferase (PAPS reductase)/FAD synthetase